LEGYGGVSGLGCKYVVFLVKWSMFGWGVADIATCLACGDYLIRMAWLVRLAGVQVAAECGFGLKANTAG